MSSFISRGAVLASARLLNQALMLLSPLLLVRLLDIVDYGRYRQFMAIAMLITSLGGTLPLPTEDVPLVIVTLGLIIALTAGEIDLSIAGVLTQFG